MMGVSSMVVVLRESTMVDVVESTMISFYSS